MPKQVLTKPPFLTSGWPFLLSRKGRFTAGRRQHADPRSDSFLKALGQGLICNQPHGPSLGSSFTGIRAQITLDFPRIDPYCRRLDKMAAQPSPSRAGCLEQSPLIYAHLGDILPTSGGQAAECDRAGAQRPWGAGIRAPRPGGSCPAAGSSSEDPTADDGAAPLLK